MHTYFRFLGLKGINNKYALSKATKFVTAVRSNTPSSPGQLWFNPVSSSSKLDSGKATQGEKAAQPDCASGDTLNEVSQSCCLHPKSSPGSCRPSNLVFVQRFSYEYLIIPIKGIYSFFHLLPKTLTTPLKTTLSERSACDVVANRADSINMKVNS